MGHSIKTKLLFKGKKKKKRKIIFFSSQLRKSFLVLNFITGLVLISETQWRQREEVIREKRGGKRNSTGETKTGRNRNKYKDTGERIALGEPLKATANCLSSPAST